MELLRRLKAKRNTKTQHSNTAPVVSASTSTITEPANDNLTKIDAIQNAGKLFEVLGSVGEASDLLSPLKAICGVLRIATEMALVGKLHFSLKNTDKCPLSSFFIRTVKICKIW
jgi:hypothetical protein